MSWCRCHVRGEQEEDKRDAGWPASRTIDEKKIVTGHWAFCSSLRPGRIDHVVYKHIMFVAVTVIDVPVQVQRLPVQAPRLPVRHPHDDSVIHAFLYGFCSTIQQKVLQRAARLA